MHDGIWFPREARRMKVPGMLFMLVSIASDLYGWTEYDDSIIDQTMDAKHFELQSLAYYNWLLVRANGTQLPLPMPPKRGCAAKNVHAGLHCTRHSLQAPHVRHMDTSYYHCASILQPVHTQRNKRLQCQ